MKKSAAAALILMVLLFGGAYLTATEPDAPAPDGPVPGVPARALPRPGLLHPHHRKTRRRHHTDGSFFSVHPKIPFGTPLYVPAAAVPLH